MGSSDVDKGFLGLTACMVEHDGVKCIRFH